MNALEVTPEAMENLRAALSSAVTDLEQNVETKIKAGFASTQTAIDQSMVALTSSTATAVANKKTADDADATWISCVTDEKADLVAVEDARVELQKAEDSKVVPCQQQVDRTPFSFDPTLDFHFSCEFATPGFCDTQLSNYKAQVNDMLSTLDSDVQAASASYDVAKAACDSAKADIVAKTAALGAAEDAYNGQKTICLGEHETRQLALCDFGTSLQAKCSVVDSYNSLMADIDQVNGGAYSQPDREAEWDTTATTKCLLNQIIAGADVDSAALASCKASIDFASQVGVLDRKQTQFAQETTPENFTCAETTITFTGQIWDIPQGADPRSAATC